ncbi:hypothetical protein BIWAKO_02269 [Bosea sp. BIWAKO-01]|nr:hypothetical protein BIWAKO_02269 [Bosea sp. BIWAKO-01]
MGAELVGCQWRGHRNSSETKSSWRCLARRTASPQGCRSGAGGAPIRASAKNFATRRLRFAALWAISPPRAAWRANVRMRV